MDKKMIQLGIPVGTAQHRLRKSILYACIVKLAENVCYRCNTLIENEDELSIEHKIAWLDSEDPIKLFYDLDNIAFSHLSCNSRVARRNSTNPQIRGEKHHNAKLTEEQVLEIRAKYATGKYTYEVLAQKYGILRPSIEKIINRKKWKHI